MLLTVGLTPAGAAEPVRQYALTHGHIDLFEVTYDDGADDLVLSVKDDTGIYDPGAEFRDPDDVSVVIDEELSAFEIPEGLPSSYDFLGEEGETIHLLGQGGDDQGALPWPGWSTERLLGTLPAGTTLAAGSPVKLEFEVEGPGDVYQFMTDPFGEPINKYIDTVDPAADVIPVPSHAHVHTNWAFTEPGDYVFTVTPTAVTTGQPLTGPAASYHIRIGDAEDQLGLSASADIVQAGRTVRLTGSGLAPREPYSIAVEGQTVKSGKANSKGSVGATVKIPATLPDGPATIQITAASDSVGSTSIHVVNAKAFGVTADPATVAKGGTSTATVSGMAPGEKVRLTFNGRRISPNGAVAAANGTYAVNFNVGTRTGTRVLKATGHFDARKGESLVVVTP